MTTWTNSYGQITTGQITTGQMTTGQMTTLTRTNDYIDDLSVYAVITKFERIVSKIAVKTKFLIFRCHETMYSW